MDGKRTDKKEAELICKLVSKLIAFTSPIWFALIFWYVGIPFIETSICPMLYEQREPVDFEQDLFAWVKTVAASFIDAIVEMICVERGSIEVMEGIEKSRK